MSDNVNCIDFPNPEQYLAAFADGYGEWSRLADATGKAAVNKRTRPGGTSGCSDRRPLATAGEPFIDH